MTGAEVVVRTLLASGVNVCFANPGTSEMHFIAALDNVDGMRCVLGLAEGVVTGAADGYYRVSGTPACTLLHLAPGFTNGASNLHNARKAHSGVVNIVGQHATHHMKYDAPLTADVEGVVRPMTDWMKTSRVPGDAAADAAHAVQAARTAPGNVATLILPADVSWTEAGMPAAAILPPPPKAITHEALTRATLAIRGPGSVVMLLGGSALRGKALDWAARIAAATNCKLMAPSQTAFLERGVGRPEIARLPHEVDGAVQALRGVKRIVLVGAPVPVAFFAYPGKPSLLAPNDCEVVTFACPDDDIETALEALAREVGASDTVPHLQQARNVELPGGTITPEGIGAVLGALIPKDAIVADESISMGRGFAVATANAQQHVWMNSMGASLGYALPVSVGAAMAAPDRRVIALVGDGSAMYTIQALWTMAREKLNVTVIILANSSYNVLRIELAKVGVNSPGRVATEMLSLDDPTLDWVALSKGHGVSATRAQTLEDLARALEFALTFKGPYLIEAVA